MSVLAALWEAAEAARADARGVDAAAAVLRAGGSPVRALDAFVEASGSRLGGEAAGELRRGLGLAVRGLYRGVLAGEWLARQGPRLGALAGELGWRAGSWRARVEGWLDDEPS